MNVRPGIAGGRERCIQEHSSGPEWRFYVNAEPSEAVKHELELALG
jgi:hypothetical protein